MNQNSIQSSALENASASPSSSDSEMLRTIVSQLNFLAESNAKMNEEIHQLKVEFSKFQEQKIESQRSSMNQSVEVDSEIKGGKKRKKSSVVETKSPDVELYQRWMQSRTPDEYSLSVRVKSETDKEFNFIEGEKERFRYLTYFIFLDENSKVHIPLDLSLSRVHITYKRAAFIWIQRRDRDGNFLRTDV